MQALEDTKSNDLLFWASRYHLFVSWSPDGSHPWDSLPAAGQHATLEIGSLRGSPDKVLHALLLLHPRGGAARLVPHLHDVSSAHAEACGQLGCWW